MKIAGNKCETFEIATTRDSWYVVNPNLHLGKDEYIPQTLADGTIHYLGVTLPPG